MKSLLMERIAYFLFHTINSAVLTFSRFRQVPLAIPNGTTNTLPFAGNAYIGKQLFPFILLKLFFCNVPFPVLRTVKWREKQNETQNITTLLV